MTAPATARGAMCIPAWRVFQLIWALLMAMEPSARPQDALLGTIAGVVVNNWNGAPVPGVVVTVRGTTLAAQTDSAGRYELRSVAAGDQVIRFSKAGFASAVVTDVRVLAGQSTTVNGNMRPEFYEMEEYEVTAEEFKEQTEKILFERQQSGALLDAIGSEQFSKLGASDAGQIISRVSGVSVVGGKYAVVRGLSDRYTRTLLNGVEVPSADPYRMSPQLDLFPSPMIDHVGVSKTFTPDQPGGTGGGTIDIATKSFPEKPFFKVTYENSYNPNSNLRNDFLADPKASMGMFSFPTHVRALNPGLYGLTNAVRPPGPSSRRETQERANERAKQANEAQKLLRELGMANFAGTEHDSPLNSKFDVSTGTTLRPFDRPLGLFAGINYKRNFEMIEEGEVSRYSPEGLLRRSSGQERGNIKTDYGANVNIGYDILPEHKIGFNFMYANSTDEEARHSSHGFVEGREDFLEQWQLHLTEREIFNYQVNGEHIFPIAADGKLNWVVGIADTTQHEPDHRFMNYYVTTDGQAQFGDASLPTPQLPARYFRDISEDSLTYRLDWTQPLGFMENESKLKAGFFSSSTTRDFQEQYFAYNLSEGFDPKNPNSYLNDPNYLHYVPDYLGGFRTNYSFIRYIDNTFSHPYDASLDITAGYGMADIAVTSWLRLIGGARVENTSMSIDADSGSSEIKQTDVLPAAGVVFTVWTNVFLRLGYGETVARPSFREKAAINNFLPDLGIIAYGNPALQMTSIKSYDARLEWFPAPGDVISAGVFYKELELPIELYSISLGDDIATWINREGKAHLQGIELEGRKSMEFLGSEFKGLSLGVNVSLIQSETELSESELINKRRIDPGTDSTRPLYDQSPYIINLDLTYAHPKSGTTFAIGANMTGERIVLATAQGPDIYEHPPITLDAAITQRFAKYWTARFAVKNILNSEFLQTYGEKDDGPVFQSYRRGPVYSLSLTAEF